MLIKMRHASSGELVLAYVQDFQFLAELAKFFDEIVELLVAETAVIERDRLNLPVPALVCLQQRLNLVLVSQHCGAVLNIQHFQIKLNLLQVVDDASNNLWVNFVHLVAGFFNVHFEIADCRNDRLKVRVLFVLLEN